MKSKSQTSIYPHKELTYKIIGICYKVYNSLGSDYLEKHYQRAIEEEARLKKIPVERELKVDIYYREKIIGKYYLDFVFGSKVALEIKKKPVISSKNIQQMLRYLNSLKLKIGLVVNFGGENLQVKRVILPDKYLFKPV